MWHSETIFYLENIVDSRPWKTWVLCLFFRIFFFSLPQTEKNNPYNDSFMIKLSCYLHYQYVCCVAVCCDVRKLPEKCRFFKGIALFFFKCQVWYKVNISSLGIENFTVLENHWHHLQCSVLTISQSNLVTYIHFINCAQRFSGH